MIFPSLKTVFDFSNLIILSESFESELYILFLNTFKQFNVNPKRICLFKKPVSKYFDDLVNIFPLSVSQNEQCAQPIIIYDRMCNHAYSKSKSKNNKLRVMALSSFEKNLQTENFFDDLSYIDIKKVIVLYEKKEQSEMINDPNFSLVLSTKELSKTIRDKRVNITYKELSDSKSVNNFKLMIRKGLSKNNILIIIPNENMFNMVINAIQLSEKIEPISFNQFLKLIDSHPQSEEKAVKFHSKSEFKEKSKIQESLQKSISKNLKLYFLETFDDLSLENEDLRFQIETLFESFQTPKLISVESEESEKMREWYNQVKALFRISIKLLDNIIHDKMDNYEISKFRSLKTTNKKIGSIFFKYVHGTKVLLI